MVERWLTVSPRTMVAGVLVMSLVFMVQEMATLRPAAQMYSTLGRAARSQPTFDLVMDSAEMALEASAARLPSDVAAASRGAHIHRLKDLSHLMADLELEDLQAELGSLHAVSPAQHALLESEAHGGGALGLGAAAVPAAMVHAALYGATAPTTRPRSSPPAAALTLKGPLVSIFTTVIDRKDTLKAFIQGNTIQAYAYLAPEVAATVFTESDVWVKKARDAGVIAATEFPKNPHGTPLIKGMYNHIEKTFRTPKTTAFFYGYSNADILYSQTLIDTLLVIHRDIVLGRIKPRVLIVGQRINRPVTEDKDKITSKHELTPLVLRLAKTGKLFQTNAQDFFFITKGTFDWGKIPDFVIGRHAYDNWLVDYSVHHADIDVIDVTRTVHAVHQTGKDGDFAWMSKKRPPDYYWNEHRGNNAYDHGKTSESNWLTRFDAQQRIFTSPRLGGSDFDATEIEAIEEFAQGGRMLHYTTHSDLLHRHLTSFFTAKYTLVEHGENNRCQGSSSRAERAHSTTVLCHGPDRGDSKPRTYSMWKAYVEAGQEAQLVDAALIDGRARIACVAMVMKLLRSDDSVVFFHDWKREYYHVVLELFTLVKHVKSTKPHGGGLAVLKPKPGVRATFDKEAWLRKHSLA